MARRLRKLAQSVENQYGCFFHDNVRRADVALVYSKPSPALAQYVTALEELGLELEFNEDEELHKYFLIIHIPHRKLRNYAKIYDIGLEIPITLKKKRASFKWMDTNLDVPAKIKGVFTSTDRILIIYKLLEHARYGTEDDEVGLSQLLKHHVLVDAYPLHDGTVDPPSNPQKENDRRLLYVHWANLRCWYKFAPLDLVQKYFGCEIAFYFAWVEFFTLMLLPAATLGVLTFIINFILLFANDNSEVNEICDAKSMYMCPPCTFMKHCHYKAVSYSCFIAEGNFIFDNALTVTYAIVMSFWATIFLNLWRRKQNILRMRWGVEYYDSEEADIRQEYLDELKKRNLTLTPDGLQPFLPKYVTGTRMIATISICGIMVLMVAAVAVLVMVSKVLIKAEAGISKVKFIKKKAKTIGLVSGSLLQIVFIKIFAKIYGALSLFLTKFENPRTKRGFDNSVLYKKYFLDFANNYVPFFYIAFIQGQLYKIPYRNDILRLVQTDSCQPTNCILDLCIQLAFLMVLKKFAGNILTVIILTIKTKCKKKRRNQENELPLFEADYELLPTNRYLLTAEFCEMIIEYGFVTFFIAAFPLAPLCALLNNFLEHRLDAMKLVTKFRRPVPRKMAGIGAWDGVLQAVTYLSVATNAVVIAFTSDFVWRELYRTKHNGLRGYINSTLSSYDTDDYDLFKSIPKKPPVCYYRGKRHPPDHPNQYEYTTDYWVDIAWRLICIFVFEHVIFVLNGVLSYAIPDLPKSVREQMNVDRQLAKEAKLKTINKQRQQSEKTTVTDTTSNWMMM